jgi:hypothetical protein
LTGFINFDYFLKTIWEKLMNRLIINEDFPWQGWFQKAPAHATEYNFILLQRLIVA